MEGNEIEKAAEEYARGIWYYWTSSLQYLNCKEDFVAGATWKSERENAELTRANARIEELEKDNNFMLAALEHAYDLAKCGWYHNHPHNDISESLNLAPMLKILKK